MLKVRKALKDFGLNIKAVNAILSGYEGSDKNWEDFINSFLGQDLIIKVDMVLDFKYPAWNNRLYQIDQDCINSIRAEFKF